MTLPPFTCEDIEAVRGYNDELNHKIQEQKSRAEKTEKRLNETEAKLKEKEEELRRLKEQQKNDNRERSGENNNRDEGHQHNNQKGDRRSYYDSYQDGSSDWKYYAGGAAVFVALKVLIPFFF